MNKSEHFDEVDEFVKKYDELEIKLFNGEWCVYDSRLEYPFNFIPVEQYYNEFIA